MLTFNELKLKKELLKAIKEMGFEEPMPIQEKVITSFLNKNNDIIGLAQTGTGKTGAYGLPLLHQVDTKNNRPQVFILSPTRELCIQIANELSNYAKYIDELRILAVYGGDSIEKQIKALKKGVQVVVATPGRMCDLLRRKKVDISTISSMVLDEADEMLRIGFREELDEILKQTPAEKHTLLFSATMSKEIARIASNYMNDPIEIVIGKKNIGAENVKFIYYLVNARDRYLALKRIADINPNIYGLIFCRTRQQTKEVAEKLMKDGYNADALHGDLSQAQREYVMRMFRQKNLQMLVATDVAARGLDVVDLTHVINYNLPDEIEIFTHRSGRTGRAGKTGTSIAIIHSKEIRRLAQIEKVIDKKFEQRLVPQGRDICKTQLFNIIDKMEKVKVNEKQISEFLPEVYKKLENLNREEIINQFVSLEFNRFLDYYKDAQDLNLKEDKTGKKGKKRGIGSSDTRLFINLGKKDDLTPKLLGELLKKTLNSKDLRVGKIDMMEKFSFFEVNNQFADLILRGFQNKKHQKRNLIVEVAQPFSQGKKMFSKNKKRKKPRKKN